jgi:hypothetical protein
LGRLAPFFRARCGPRIAAQAFIVIGGVIGATTGASMGNTQAAPAEPMLGDETGASNAGATAVISVDGDCPGERAIDQAITALIPRGVMGLPESARVAVEDQGETYRVGIDLLGVTHARLFRDSARDCEQRARFAAVLTVVTLLPPELPPRPVLPPPLEPPRPPAVSAPPPRSFRLELGALVEAAPSVFASASMAGVGAELRAAYRLVGPIAATLAIGAEPRIGFSTSGFAGTEARLPIDAGLRLAGAAGRFEAAAELGIALALFRAEGLDAAMPSARTRLDVGARAGVVLRLARPAARWAPFVGVHAVVFPWPYEIVVTPGQDLATTPVVWIGATAGVSMAR